MKLPNLELKALITITNKQTNKELKNIPQNENYYMVPQSLLSLMNTPKMWGTKWKLHHSLSHLESEATKTTQLRNWWNLAKLYYTKKKAPKKGREKETRGKDQSPGMQTAQKEGATRR